MYIYKKKSIQDKSRKHARYVRYSATCLNVIQQTKHQVTYIIHKTFIK